MRDLIGKKCACEFDLPFHSWPFEGTPAWVVVADVDMPMVCLRSDFGGRSIWVNASTIKSLRPYDGNYSEQFERWWNGGGREKFDGGVRYKWAAYEAWETARLTFRPDAE